MDMRNLAFKDSSFDGIISAYSLIHIPSGKIKNTLCEFKRVLKPRGKVLIIVQEGEKDKIVDEPLREGEQVFVNFFSLSNLVSDLKNAGFNVLFDEVKANHDPESMSDNLISIIAEKV